MMVHAQVVPALTVAVNHKQTDAVVTEFVILRENAYAKKATLLAHAV